MVNGNSFETGKIYVIEGSRQVLVKVTFFQLMERVHPQDGAMPNLFYKSKSSLLMLSIGISFVLNIFWKFDKNFKNSISRPICMADPVYASNYDSS